MAEAPRVAVSSTAAHLHRLYKAAPTSRLSKPRNKKRADRASYMLLSGIAASNP